MTTASFMSVSLSASMNVWAPTIVFMPIDSSTFAGLVFSPYARLPVVQYKTKLFFIKKPVTVVNNIPVQIYTKGTI